MLRVYSWMAAGLLLTGIIAYANVNTNLIGLFYQQVATQAGTALQPTGLAVISIFTPLIFVMVLSFGVNRLSHAVAQTLYWLFCAAMGLSLTNIFLIFTADSIERGETAATPARSCHRGRASELGCGFRLTRRPHASPPLRAARALPAAHPRRELRCATHCPTDPGPRRCGHHKT
ncbi:MAG: Bax inhibitor-1 family protein, partial [Acetobacteraceae bacterium]